jgi:signal transduction histidine kinase
MSAEGEGRDVVRAEAMLAIADLLGGVLHDLNNPLAAVLGQAEVLQERFALGRDRTAAERISRAARRVAGLARSLVRVAKEAPEEPTPVSLNALVEETLPLFAHSLLVKGVALETRLALDTPGLVARPRDLRLLVVALLGPALEVAGRTRPSSLRLETSCPRTGTARLEVVSPERSIDAGFEPRVFQTDGDGPSLYLAERETQRLGGVLTLQGGLLRVDLPARGRVAARS